VALLLCTGLRGATAAGERVIHVTAKKFEYTPATIELKVGEPVVLELTALDRRHGFRSADLNIDVVIEPGTPTRVHLVPDKPGRFEFHCSVFCGSGHEDMTGVIVVSP
jgi:cytochrome c oxidase subunit 2